MTPSDDELADLARRLGGQAQPGVHIDDQGQRSIDIREIPRLPYKTATGTSSDLVILVAYSLNPDDEGTKTSVLGWTPESARNIGLRLIELANTLETPL